MLYILHVSVQHMSNFSHIAIYYNNYSYTEPAMSKPNIAVPVVLMINAAVADELSS